MRMLSTKNLICTFLVLLATSLLFVSQVRAALFTATLLPVEICKDDGSDCHSSEFDVPAFQSVFAQAGIAIDILPSTTLNHTLLWDFSIPPGPNTNPLPSSVVTDNDRLDYLFDLPTPENTLVNYFTTGTGALGLSLVGEPASYTRPQGTLGIPNDKYARFLARQVGLGMAPGFSIVGSDDPLNLFCEPTICDYFNADFGHLNSQQVSFMIQSQFVSAVPVPPAIWLFISALVGLIGYSRRRKDS